ncbi:hypothetical protein ACEWY4_004746 [Coilia grayii]|uniref:Uncharacterized protein n=1 Tax=Coilia grayii TaxID=363190 RepID=A0ABD1KMK8_9TELE
MNISLENPYGSVTIPRAQLRTSDDNSTVIINPMALGRNTSANPYDGVYSSEAKNGQNPPPYGGEGNYTVKEDEEQVSRCYACCRRCRRK